MISVEKISVETYKYNDGMKTLCIENIVSVINDFLLGYITYVYSAIYIVGE